METKTNRLKRAFVKSFPYAVIASIPLFLGLLYKDYRRDYPIASSIADSNNDGIVTEQEWREAYTKVGLSYEHNPTFQDISDIEKIIHTHNSEVIPKK